MEINDWNDSSNQERKMFKKGFQPKKKKKKSHWKRRTSTTDFIQNTSPVLHKNRQPTITTVSLWSHYGWKSVKWEKVLQFSCLKLTQTSPLLYYCLIIKSQILHTMNSEHMNYSYRFFGFVVGFFILFCFFFPVLLLLLP